MGEGTLAELNIKTINAQREFLDKLAGVDDPEAKRKIIGATFIEVFDREATALQDVNWLAQGTIYPDVIESAASKYGKAHVIKSHHNVGGLPERMTLKLVEPLRELFKDEVRKIGLHLGLPPSLIYRHPFPGPGLGVRILGKSSQAMRMCCAKPMRSSFKSFERRIYTIRCLKPLPSICR